MKIFITKHAYMRIKQRVGPVKVRFKELVDMAYNSQEEISEAFLQSKYNMKNFRYTTYQYRQFQGFIYAFQERGSEAVCLLTIFSDDQEYLKRHAYDPKKTATRDVI
jgi:hypothetical protein